MRSSSASVSAVAGPMGGGGAAVAGVSRGLPSPRRGAPGSATAVSPPRLAGANGNGPGGGGARVQRAFLMVVPAARSR